MCASELNCLLPVLEIMGGLDRQSKWLADEGKDESYLSYGLTGGLGNKQHAFRATQAAKK